MSREINGYPITEEQDVAVDLAITGESLKIEARAGAGKTTTLRAVARELPGKGLYIAFNKAIADEASRVFPKTVMCRTVHSLAYREVGVEYKDRLQGRLTGKEVASRLGFGDWEGMTAAAVGSLLIAYVTRYCHSADDKVSLDHAPWSELMLPIEDDGERKAAARRIMTQLLPLAQRLWGMLIDKNRNIPITHDVYLKLWALGKPMLPVDYCLVDEAQDINPVIIGLLEHQRCQVILVGDNHQQIYSWRGAVNAMASVDTAHSCEITQSFRFGEAIAQTAMKVLKHQLGVDVLVRGFNQVHSIVTTEEVANPQAILCRTNRTVISVLIDMVKAGVARDVAVVGGVNDLIQLLYGVRDLQNGERTSVTELAAFESWAEVMEHSETEAGTDLKVLVTLVKEHGVSYLLQLLNQIKNNREEYAKVIISTAHKSKGREWDVVRLMDDFRTPESDPKRWTEEDANLLYVAVTRAKKVLDVSACSAVRVALAECVQ
jgi:hypothetical protein